MKKRIALLLSVILIVSSVFAPYSSAADCPRDIRTEYSADYSGKTIILHSNDVHGGIDGYAKAARLKTDLEAMGAEVILVDAGDYAQGSPNVNISSGLDAVRLMNAAGYKYATIGNHEFDYGPEVLTDLLAAAEFENLCANVYRDGKLLCRENAVYETRSGLKIGFFGIDAPETQSKAHPSKVKGIKFLSGNELYSCVNKQISDLKGKGADLIIALCHLGTNEESSPYMSTEFYAKAKGVDFVIDGHSHTVMTEGDKGEPVQSTGTGYENIGVIIIDADGKISDHFLIPTKDLEANAEIQAIADEIHSEVDAVYGKVFAVSEVILNGERNDNRSSETNNGRLATDAFRWYADNHPAIVNNDLDHVVCLMNGGGIRASLAEGEVTRSDIVAVHPFGNTVCVTKAKGSKLLELLEASTFSLPVGGYPQTQGIKFTLDLTKEFDAGELYAGSTYSRPASINRVSIQSVNGRPFDEKAEYYIIASDFIALGGDTYGVLAGKSYYDTGDALDSVLIDYIGEALGGVISEEKYKDARGDVTVIKEAPAAEPAPAEEPHAASNVYVVKKGDCLFRIAKEQLGDPYKWRSIYNLNRSLIRDPNLIYPGQELIIG